MINKLPIYLPTTQRLGRLLDTLNKVSEKVFVIWRDCYTSSSAYLISTFIQLYILLKYIFNNIETESHI